MGPAETLIAKLDRYNADLAAIAFGAPVAAVYNPHEYARDPWEAYLRRYGATPKRTIFLGMNPGPWGMAQTGVPFGEISAVRDWMGIVAPVRRPRREHPKRPILGMACTRSEVSGRRLWDLFSTEFRTAEAFFRDHLVINYCPLVFMGESGRNLTPDKLPRREREPLFALCDTMLAETIAAYRPAFVLGVGKFAEDRLTAVVNAARTTEGQSGTEAAPPPRVGRILHPSPASPAANRGWSQQARRELLEMGVWPVPATPAAP
jgi:single-strand selective monofunctional uracil DNA glycosylase